MRWRGARLEGRAEVLLRRWRGAERELEEGRGRAGLEGAGGAPGAAAGWVCGRVPEWQFVPGQVGGLVQVHPRRPAVPGLWAGGRALRAAGQGEGRGDAWVRD